MKRLILTLPLVAVLLQSCIGAVMPTTGYHDRHKMNLEGYAERLVERYYKEVRYDFNTDRKKYGGYEPIDEHSWKRVFNEYFAESGVQENVTVIITKTDTQLAISISGDRVEGCYVTIISTPGDIINDNGIFRIEISENGTPKTWVEYHLSDSYSECSFSRGDL